MTPIFSSKEIIIGIIGFIVFASLAILLAYGIYMSSLQDYYKYQQAPQTDRAEIFAYMIETKVGNILVNGLVTAREQQTWDNIKGEYSIIRELTEEYRQHTRTVSYPCGTAKAPKTCSRIETYHSWDNIDEKVKQTSGYKVHGIEIPNICGPSAWSLVNMDELYTGDQEHDRNYIKQGGGFFENKRRISYYTAPLEFNATLLIQSNEKGIVTPDGESCMPMYIDKNFEQVIETKEPKLSVHIIVTAVIILIATSTYIGVAIKNEF